MDEKVKSSNLYRWQRQEKPRILTRNNHIKSTDDIKDWIKTVEEATDKATDASFGLVQFGKQKGKSMANLISNQVRDNEFALTEAHELLTQWMSEKVQFDYDDGLDELETWRRDRRNKFDAAEKGQIATHGGKSIEKFDLEDDLEIDEAAIYKKVKQKALGDADPYENLYELEDSQAVEAVVKSLLSKELVNDRVKKDLGLSVEPKPDPRTKMELRHTLVKQNRDKREKEERRKKSEAQLKKEARLHAEQLIQKEQKEREMRSRKEEMELKKEMAKIRKEMHEERIKKIEKMKHEKEEEMQLEKLAREKLKEIRAQEEQTIILSQRLESEKKYKKMLKIEAVKSKIASRNLQCLHKHFSIWYNLVLSRRLLMGKVKAMSDWKLMLKIWGAWRSYVRSQKIDMEVEKHEKDVIDSQRKNMLADKHWTHSTLSHCFLNWKIFTRESVERKELEKEQEHTKQKMFSLLKAVAEGKMNKEKNSNEAVALTENQTKRSKKPQAENLQIVSIEDEEFNKPDVKLAWGDTTPSTTSVTRPTEPWQVTPQHLKTFQKDLSNNSLQNGNMLHSNEEIRKRYGTQPWMNKQFIVNNLEHRYSAQQQILKEQQSKLKEQQRLIEVLQYEQKQQNLKQRLKLGVDAPPLPPLEAIEELLPGKPILRGDKPNVKSTIAVSNNNVQKLDKDLSEDSDRTNATTARSELTTVSSVSQRTASTNCQNTKYLQVLKNMEQRAAERARIKYEREEKRRKQEEEKVAQLQKEEQEKQREIEAEKQAKAAAFRQKKFLEKQKEEEKKRQIAVMETMNRRAEEHYTKSLLKYRGLLPFKKLISLSKRNWLKAVKHQERDILKKCFKGWKLFLEEEQKKKEKLADQMHQFLTIKHTFHSWKNFKYHTQFLERRASRHYLDNLKSKSFQAWAEWAVVEKENSLNKEHLARQHYIKNLIQKTFKSWRFLKEYQKREELRQKRKEELRKKVTAIIPDFVARVSTPLLTSEDLS